VARKAALRASLGRLPRYRCFVPSEHRRFDTRFHDPDVRGFVCRADVDFPVEATE
jgi:hypothetical protein